MVDLRTYKVESREKTFAVTVEPKHRRHYRVRVKDEILECVCESSDDISTWTIRREGTRTHARAWSPSSNRVEISIGGLPFVFTVTPMRIEDIKAVQPVSAEGLGGIHAIMPGRITSILVGPGEEVLEGTPLIILEAMKMQNEIVSHKSGRVISVKVREGDTVKKGDLLVQIR